MFEKRKIFRLFACIPRQSEQSSHINLEYVNTTKTQEIEELNNMKENGKGGAKRKGVKSPNKKSEESNGSGVIEDGG
jgi:hypothetical protein